jgi:hypothetical protein
MFPFFSSLFGFVPTNEYTISWEAMAMRQREEELFYAIKTDVQWSEEELEKIKHLIHHPLFNVNRLYHTENIMETLLHCAIKTKQFELAVCLVEKDADLTLQDTQGHTPLQRLSKVKSDITPALNALKDALKREDYISHLPTELLINIFDRLSLESLSNVSKVSPRFNKVIQGWRFWMKYLHLHYQDLMKVYIKRLQEDNQDEFQVEQKVGRYLRKVIKEAPYTIQAKYLGLIFQEEYQKWQRVKDSSQCSADYIYGKIMWGKRGKGVDSAIIVLDLTLRNTLFKGSTLRQYMRPELGELHNFHRLGLLGAIISENFTFKRNIILLVLNLPELWNQFIEECRQDVNINCTLAQIVVAETKTVILDEEMALTFLRHAKFRKFLLADSVDSLEWLLYIFEKSIQYELYYDFVGLKQKPITYELVGASRLSSALFILNDKDYREKLEKGLREDQRRLASILRRLQDIRFDDVEAAHRGDAGAEENAKLILEKLRPLIAPEISSTLMPTPSRHC